MPFIHRLRDRLSPGHVPLFLSDGLRQYHALLTAHFGTWVEGVWVVSSQIHLAQIVKILRSRRLIATFPRALCGSLRHVRQQLRELGFTGIIQTSFIERVNLSIRHGVGALHRRTWATCRRHDRLQTHVALYLSFYHFVRPHPSLRQEKLTRTPAMAAGLTDPRWSVEEWRTRPVYG